MAAGRLVVRHDGVDVSVVDAVEGVGGTGGQSSAHQNRDGCSTVGRPCAARNIVGTAVTRRSSMMRGFVRATCARTVSLMPRRAAIVVAMHGSPSEVSCSSECCY